MANVFTSSILADFDQFKWLGRLEPSVQLDVGQLTPFDVKVPVRDAQKILNQVVRLVLDLPRNSTPTVVWTQGDSELLVHSDKTRIACSSGVITITVAVECDQHPLVTIPVPIGTGDRDSPAGLVMSSFSDLEGPEEIVETWFDPIVAFAWELIIEIARVIAAQVGKDSRGRALVPGSIGAAPRLFLIQPVARFRLSAGD